MNRTLNLTNRQRVKPISTATLKRGLASFLKKHCSCEHYDLGVFLVDEPEMTRLNEEHLRHAGCTDVITFDYCDHSQPDLLAGEIFVCVPEAIKQARTFQTTWFEEVLRYIVHGILHLEGFDDHDPADRREMKRHENRLLRALVSDLGRRG